MKNIIYLYLFIIILFWSCGNSSETKTLEPKTTESPLVVTDASPYISGIYDKFDDLAPIFEFQNDTTYVINFWATWCMPCVEELPYFEAANKAFAGEKIRIILVSLDAKKHIETKLKSFIEKEKIMSEVVVLTDGDANSWIDKVSPEWDGAIPITILYNADEYEIIFGALENYEELNSIIKSLIKS